MSVLSFNVAVELPAIESDDTGKTRSYKIAGMGPGVRMQYVAILKERAWRELDEQADRMAVSRFNRMESSIMRDMAAGKYEWNDEIHTSIDGTRAGFVCALLARLRIGTGVHDLPESLVGELIDRYGFERLNKLIQQADGPTPKNESSPDAEKPAGAAA